MTRADKACPSKYFDGSLRLVIAFHLQLPRQNPAENFLLDFSIHHPHEKGTQHKQSVALLDNHFSSTNPSNRAESFFSRLGAMHCECKELLKVSCE